MHNDELINNADVQAAPDRTSEDNGIIRVEDNANSSNDETEVIANDLINETDAQLPETRENTLDTKLVDTSDLDQKSQWHSVDKILSMRRKGAKTFYRVQWSDALYSSSWIPACDLSDALKDVYHTRRTKQGRLRKVCRNHRRLN